MGGLLVVAGLIVLSRLLVVAGCMFVVLRGFLMMLMRCHRFWAPTRELETYCSVSVRYVAHLNMQLQFSRAIGLRAIQNLSQNGATINLLLGSTSDACASPREVLK